MSQREEDRIAELEAALALLREEKEKMIAPLERSDDPEQDIVWRIDTPGDYVLCAIAAYEQEMRTANAKGRKEVEAQLATLQAALKTYGQHLATCQMRSYSRVIGTNAYGGIMADVDPPVCTCGLADLWPSSDTETR